MFMRIRRLLQFANVQQEGEVFVGNKGDQCGQQQRDQRHQQYYPQALMVVKFGQSHNDRAYQSRDGIAEKIEQYRILANKIAHHILRDVQKNENHKATCRQRYEYPDHIAGRPHQRANRSDVKSRNGDQQ